MKYISQVIFILLAAFCFASLASADSPYFKIVEQSSDAIVLEWEGPALQWRNVTLDGRAYAVPSMASLPLLQEPGKPQLPVDAYTVQAGSVAVVVLDSVYEEMAAARICPAPTPDFSDSTRTVLSYIEDKIVYETSRYYPHAFVTGEAGRLYRRQFHRIQINPVKVSPASGRVQVLRYIKLRIQSNGAAPSAAPMRSPLDEKLDRLPRLSRPSSEAELSLQKSGGLDDPGPRVKLYIVDDGVYGVSGSQLANAGVSLAALTPQKLKLHNRGRELPCKIIGGEDGRFDANDQVVFYAERLSGDGEFYHAYSDTNIYWLSWGDGDGLRLASAPGGEASEFVYTFPERLHFEEDREYYQGDTNAEIQETEIVSGEGWVWDRAIDPGETFSVNFDLPGFVLPQDSVALIFRIRGETRDSQPDAHHVRVAVNGVTVYDAFFDDREEIRPDLRLAAKVLKDSANVLEVSSVRQGDRRSRFYFDWFEVAYERRLQAIDGWLHIDSMSVNEPRIHWAGGFRSEDVSVWDLAAGLETSPQQVGKNWAAALRVESAAILDGNYANFYLENNLLYAGTRGISVVVLGAGKGKVLAKKSFDTFGSASQSDSLAAFLNALPNEVVVLAGVRDDGANSLTASAVQAFQSLGSREIGNLQYRESWAFIARKGDATPLAELRTGSGEGPAQVSVLFTFEESDSYTVQFVADGDADVVVFDAAAVKPPVKIKFKESNPLAQIVGADYIIVAHEKFLSDANRLADYRRGRNGFQTAVINVEDVYDAYNDGILSPEAIRRMMKDAVARWMPPPSFLLLFGDASWDMKGHYPSTQFSNFVPSMGNPVSDVLLVCLDGPNDYLPDVSIGRIPATTGVDAQAAVDKIIEYESAPSQAWKKNFLFISGGYDADEQQLFQKQSHTLAKDFVETAPTFGRSVYVSKNAEENQADERALILDRINEGALWINFIGHAASRTWELMFNNPDIEDLGNKGRYPFISSMTCHTGRFAEPNQESFGERFLLIPEKGAVSFWGTSGWGYSYEDYLYLRQLFPTVLADTVRYMGDIITLTKFAVWRKYGFGAHYKNLILQYNLMGDPALTLALPTEPDLTITDEDIRIDPAVPSEADSTANIFVRVQNWGLAPRDSVDVQLTIEHSTSHHLQQARLSLPPVGLVDSTAWVWPLQGMAGAVAVTAAVDPDNIIDEWDEQNNEQSIQATVLSSYLELVSPPQNSIVPLDQAILKVQAPQQYFDENNRFIFQIDSSRSFDSPLLQSSDLVRAHPLVIKWRPESLLPGQRYYWRVYNAEQPDSLFLAVFYTSASDSFGWRQDAGDVASRNDFINTEWTPNGAQLSRQSIPVLIQSAWTSSQGYAVIEVNDKSALQTGRGYNFAVMDQSNGALLDAVHFDVYGDAAAVGRMVQFLSAIPNGRIVLGAISDEGSVNVTEEAYAAIESIGSAHIREVEYRSMWAIIGRKGASPGSVPEGVAAFQSDGSVVLKDTLRVLHATGRIVSERIGPASKWLRAAFDVEHPDSCEFSMSIYGHQKNTADAVRIVSDVTHNEVDLSTIDAQEFPYLTLAMDLRTQNGDNSPTLRSWEMFYQPSPDLALSPQLFTQSADTVLVGQSVTFYLDVYNIGLHDARNVGLVFEEGNRVNGRTPFAEIDIDSIVVDRFAPVEQTWQAGAIPGLKKIFVVVDARQDIAELSETNNSISAAVYVHNDTLKPSIELTFDDRVIFDGDLVSATPIITARLYDNNPTPFDTTRINVFLDGQRVSFAQGLLTIQPSDDAAERGVLVFKPALSDGRHDLIIDVADVSHNTSTTSIRFLVDSDLALRDALNYPNPFDRDTEFRFSLTKQAEVQIKVFTVAGRLIRTLDLGFLPVGYNSVYWDGRDESGDRLANGVYIYKISAATESESAEAVSKVIVMR